MGFSTVGSFLMMFFAIIIMVSSVFMIYTSLIENTSAISEQQKIREKKLDTSISIINVSIDKTPSPDRTTINVINDGSRKISFEDVDVYMDGLFIPRDKDNRTISFHSENIINPLHWDPEEVLQINMSKDIENGTHSVVVAGELGVRDKTIFTYN